MSNTQIIITFAFASFLLFSVLIFSGYKMYKGSFNNEELQVYLLCL